MFNDQRKGVYNLKIQGQVCHTTPDILIPEQGNPHHSQIYVYDDQYANRMRLDSMDNLSGQYINIISTVLNSNPYVLKYKHLYELSKEQTIPKYELLLLRNKNFHKKNYDLPQTSECGALII